MFEGLLQPTHLILILAIALLGLGPKRRPEAGRGLGQALRGFKDSLTEKQDEEPAATEDHRLDAS